MLLLLLAAFGLRMWQLGYKSLWLDEGISVTFSIDGPPRIFDVLIERDLHPPLYYLLIWGWTQLGGLSEWSVRYPSMSIGVLLVALLYRFGRALYAGRATALLASALAAASPFLIYYSQEARMYGALAAAGLAATLGLRAALERGGRWRWVVYALLLALPPYLHHFGWMVVAFHGAFALLTWRRYRGGAFAWALAVSAVLVAYLPWVRPALQQILRLRDTPDFWLGALSLWYVAQHAFAAFAVGFGGALERYLPVLVLFAGAFVLGTLYVAWRGLLLRRVDDLLIALYVLLPTAILYAIVAQNPKFADRYLILIVPPFLLLLARGIVGVAELGTRLRLGALRVVAALLALGMVAVSCREAARVYEDDAYAKEDYRGAVDYMIRNWQTGDAAVLMLDSYQVFDYYSHGRLKRYGLNPTDDLQFAAGHLNEIVRQGHPRIWVLMWNPDWADPTGSVRALLDETLVRVPIEVNEFRRLPIRLYSLDGRPTFDARPRPPVETDFRFGDGPRLFGLDLGPADPVVAGESRPIRLFWEPLRVMAEELRISLRLTRDGREWWRWDGSPAAPSYPTTYWKPGLPVRGVLKIEVPAGTPPGAYELSLVMYHSGSGRTLGAPARLATIDVARPEGALDPGRLPIPTRPPVDLGGGVELVGQEWQGGSVDAGATIELALGWRLASAPSVAARRLTLVDAAGRSWPLWDGMAYPTARWRQGELVLDRIVAVVPPGAATGAARLQVSVDGSTELGWIEVRSRPRSFAAPSVGRTLDVTLGDFARLVGVEVPPSAARGKAARVVLHWQARAHTRVGHTVFVHLIDAADRPVAQRDATPGNGALPTTGWLSGEFLRDEYSLAVPVGLEAGTYRLAVGMYEPRSGRRVPVVGPHGPEPGDRVIVATVAVR